MRPGAVVQNRGHADVGGEEHPGGETNLFGVSVFRHEVRKYHPGVWSTVRKYYPLRLPSVRVCCPNSARVFARTSYGLHTDFFFLQQQDVRLARCELRVVLRAHPDLRRVSRSRDSVLGARVYVLRFPNQAAPTFTAPFVTIYSALRPVFTSTGNCFEYITSALFNRSW